NNFGAHFMQVVRSLKADVEQAANDGISNGDATILLRIDNVGPDDNAGVPGALYVARGLGSTPTWTDADRFPIDPTSLLDGADLPAQRASFPAGYMNGGIWVSGPIETTTAQIDFTFGASKFGLRVDALQLAVDLSAGVGTLAGYTKVDTLRASLEPGLAGFG